jgi:hypothetical protein
MKKTFIALALLAGVAGCTQTEQGAAIGGLGGAAIGAAVAGPGDRVPGAVIGGAVGAAAGALVGRAADRRSNQCVYRGRGGREYLAACPAGY